MSRRQFSPRARIHALRLSVLASALVLAGCASTAVQPLPPDALSKSTAERRAAERAAVPPLGEQLTLQEALARALKYNLDRRTKLMEEAIALNQLDVSRYEMWPKLVASAGYSARNNDRIVNTVNSQTGATTLSNALSSERNHVVTDLGLTWNLLDFGLGYYNSRQQADRALVALERRRKAMHLLVQDVRSAYWRALAAQQLQSEITVAIRNAEEALADSRKSEAERLRAPLDSLRYQRQLLESLRLLEGIQQELSSAKVELAQLINVPLDADVRLADADAKPSERVLNADIATLETLALSRNADLRESSYNIRIAREEVRKAIARSVPNISFGYNLKYDTDNFLVNQRWNEAGLQISYNLFNLLTAPKTVKLAKTGVGLAEQRQLATMMSVVTQVHLARLQYANSVRQLTRADDIWQVDARIAKVSAAREAAQAQSKLEVVASQTTAIVSQLRRFQAIAQMQTALARVHASVGFDLDVDGMASLPLPELTARVDTAMHELDAVTEGKLQ